LALGTDSDADMVEDFIKTRAINLDRQKKIEFSVLLAKQTRLSQHAISDITGVSRDTIRKHLKDDKPAEGD
jgi:transcriptional antiterminator